MSEGHEQLIFKMEEIIMTFRARPQLKQWFSNEHRAREMNHYDEETWRISNFPLLPCRSGSTANMHTSASHSLLTKNKRVLLLKVSTVFLLRNMCITRCGFQQWPHLFALCHTFRSLKNCLAVWVSDFVTFPFCNVLSSPFQNFYHVIVLHVNIFVW